MSKIVQTVAMAAALVALVSSLLRGFSLGETLRRGVVGYLAFFFLAGLLALVYRAGVANENQRPPRAESPAAPKSAGGGRTGGSRAAQDSS